MTDKDGKRFFIEAYLDDVAARHSRMRQIAEQGFTEEAIILACCYLAALAQSRFPNERHDQESFTVFLRQYGPDDLFERVHLAEIIDRHENDPFAPTALNGHESVKAAVINQYGQDPEIRTDPTITELVRALTGKPRIDGGNLAANLWRYTYGAILYRRWRSPGVHSGQINVPWDVDSGRKIFQEGPNGEGVYDDGFGQLTFSANFVIQTLEHTFERLRAECLEVNAFPLELERQ